MICGEAEWEKLVKSNPYVGFMQSVMWAEFKQLLGWKTKILGIFDGTRLIGGASVMQFPFSKKKDFLYIPEGPVLPYDHADTEEMFHLLVSRIDTIAHLKGSALTTHLRIDPRLPQIPSCLTLFQKAPFNMEPKNTRMIPLKASEETFHRERSRCP